MIPWVLIATGGIMILAGVKKEKPLDIVKSVLTNTPLPTKAPVDPATASRPTTKTPGTTPTP